MKKANDTAAASKPAKKTAAKKTTVKKAAKKTAVKKAAVKKAPAAKKVEKKPTPALATTIKANVDIGFGNLLYIRGDGPGLSWEQGVPMECSKDSVWTWSTSGTSKAFTFKVLVNDVSWSVGEDYTAHAGQMNESTPIF